MAAPIKKIVKKAADSLICCSSSSSGCGGAAPFTPTPSPPASPTPSPQQPCNLLRSLLHSIDLSNDLPSIRNEMLQLLNGCPPNQSDNVYQMDTRLGRMAGAGSQILNSMEDTAQQIKSQAIGGEGNEDGISRVLSSVLETVGSIHYLSAGLSIIAVAMKSYRAYSNNMTQCSDLLTSMVELLDRLQLIWNELRLSEEQEQARLEEITRVIILGALKIHSMASKPKLSGG